MILYALIKEELDVESVGVILDCLSDKIKENYVNVNIINDNQLSSCNSCFDL